MKKTSQIGVALLGIALLTIGPLSAASGVERDERGRPVIGPQARACIDRIVAIRRSSIVGIQIVMRVSLGELDDAETVRRVNEIALRTGSRMGFLMAEGIQDGLDEYRSCRDALGTCDRIAVYRALTQAVIRLRCDTRALRDAFDDAVLAAEKRIQGGGDDG